MNMENKNEQKLKAELEIVDLDDCVLKDVTGGTVILGVHRTDKCAVKGNDFVIEDPQSPDTDSDIAIL